MDCYISLGDKCVELANAFVKSGNCFKLSVMIGELHFSALSTMEPARAKSMEKGKKTGKMMNKKSPLALRWNGRRWKAFLEEKRPPLLL